MTTALIPGGYILLARRLTDSGIMNKPHLFMKMWMWMLLQAAFKDHGNLKRGQFFTSIDRMREAFSYKVGYRIIKPSIKEIRAAYDFLAKGTMISITKVTHGMIITIINYELYQNFLNYEGHTEGHGEESTQGTILRKKERMKEKPPEEILSLISVLENKYSDRKIINQAFTAISSTRKSNHIADSKRLSILQQWGKYTVDQVMSGIRTYLDKSYYQQGKDEKYLLGIIRNNGNQQVQEGGSKTIKSTGSPLLDEDYRQEGYTVI